MTVQIYLSFSRATWSMQEICCPFYAQCCAVVCTLPTSQGHTMGKLTTAQSSAFTSQSFGWGGDSWSIFIIINKYVARILLYYIDLIDISELFNGVFLVLFFLGGGLVLVVFFFFEEKALQFNVSHNSLERFATQEL